MGKGKRGLIGFIDYGEPRNCVTATTSEISIPGRNLDLVDLAEFKKTIHACGHDVQNGEACFNGDVRLTVRGAATRQHIGHRVEGKADLRSRFCRRVVVQGSRKGSESLSHCCGIHLARIRIKHAATIAGRLPRRYTGHFVSTWKGVGVAPWLASACPARLCHQG